MLVPIKPVHLVNENRYKLHVPSSGGSELEIIVELLEIVVIERWDLCNPSS